MTSEAAAGSVSLQAALDRLVRRLHPAARGITGLQPLSGGASQEIWRFDLDGPVPVQPLVLRRAPPHHAAGGHEGAGDAAPATAGLATEAHLMRAAAAAGVPVPPVWHVLEQDDGLGAGFIMGFVEGETLGGRIVRAASLAGVRPGLAHACGGILARIHGIDPRALPALPVTTPAGQVAQWRAIYRVGVDRAGVGARPVFEAALRWLAGRAPPAAQKRLVHGDFRNGNLMIGPDGVRAVLDWELAHLGDPAEDLGWICINSWRFGEIGKAVGGFGLREDLWAGYEAAGGAPVARGAAHWWEVFGTLRWGVICAGAAASFRGADPSVERAMIARRTSETEIDLLRLLEI